MFQRFKLDKGAHSDSCKYCVSDARLNFISLPCDQSGVLQSLFVELYAGSHSGLKPAKNAFNSSGVPRA